MDLEHPHRAHVAVIAGARAGDCARAKLGQSIAVMKDPRPEEDANGLARQPTASRRVGWISSALRSQLFETMPTALEHEASAPKEGHDHSSHSDANRRKCKKPLHHKSLARRRRYRRRREQLLTKHRW